MVQILVTIPNFWQSITEADVIQSASFQELTDLEVTLPDELYLLI